MKVNYAQHADVLYVVFADTSNLCAYVELDSGVICRVDETTDKVVGITIPDFKRRVANNESILIPELDDGLTAEKLLQEYQAEQ
jgi:uncharacterized protein YuzE